jgi:hypothetical protein
VPQGAPFLLGERNVEKSGDNCRDLHGNGVISLCLARYGHGYATAARIDADKV